MKKRKPRASDGYPAWTPFVESEYDADAKEVLAATGGLPRMSFINSRYQVDVEPHTHPVFGTMVKLGIKDHWRTTRHDWRDFQRIKNELVGEQYDAVELYPAECRLVDTANQYYLYVFLDVRIPIGWNERLVSEGSYGKARQRPWDPDVRPLDLKTAEDIQAHIAQIIKKRRAHGTVGMAAERGSPVGPSDDAQ